MSFWQQVWAGNPFNPQNQNPNFVGTSLSQGRSVPDPGVPDPALFAPNYQPPRSVEINFGIQRELRHGMVFSADYLRNIETRNLPNFGNFNLPPNTMNGIVFGTGNGSINDTTEEALAEILAYSAGFPGRINTIVSTSAARPWASRTSSATA